MVFLRLTYATSLFNPIYVLSQSFGRHVEFFVAKVFLKDTQIGVFFVLSLWTVTR